MGFRGIAFLSDRRGLTCYSRLALHPLERGLKVSKLLVARTRLFFAVCGRYPVSGVLATYGVRGDGNDGR